MTKAALWGRLPQELRERKQWAVAGPSKQPMAPGPNGLYQISVTNPNQWLSFEEAAAAAYAAGTGIGYILHESDPYTCIDLDVVDADTQAAKGEAVDASKWTTQAQFNRFYKIMQAFDTYSESSQSGKGLHIWLRGVVGVGVKRDGVEVYSRERFMISTGAVVLPNLIKANQELLDVLLREIRGPQEQTLSELQELEEEEGDEEIINKAMNAGNGEKFNDLCCGQWQKYGFPSQSEADLALMSIFTFYSKSNDQCRRLFRMSSLGKREKAAKDNRYLDYTLRIIRTRQAREDHMHEHGARITSQLLQQLNQQEVEIQGAPLHVPGKGEPRDLPAPAAAAVTLAGPVSQAVRGAGESGLPWPPGMAGALAGFVYQSAPRPVKEIAIIAALGMLAGLTGKAFSIPQSGLNVYLILVARSGVGKEALHSGISALCKAGTNRCPSFMNFVNFSDFASGPALIKEVVAQQSMVNVAGEFGRKLKRMAQEDGRDGPLSTLRTTMTSLYQKSGPQAIVGGISYSNKDSNIASVSGVSYSMVGETTPNTFYEALTDSMMEDGFLSRFTVVEYDGPRVPLNVEAITEPSKALGDALGDLAQYCQHLIGHDKFVTVQRTDEAAQIMWSFEQECDNEINSTKDETWRQMWNRASLKVMRVAAILGVADNWMHPVIRKEHVEWALELIRRDIGIMRRRLESGDVGSGDHTRERKLLSIMEEYLAQPLSLGYKIPIEMKEIGIIPRKFLQIRAARVTAFTAHRLGASAALDLTMRSLADSGYVMELDKAKMVEQFGFHGKCFRILTLPDYSSERAASK